MRKKLLAMFIYILTFPVFFLVSCGGGEKSSEGDAPPPQSMVAADEAPKAVVNRGIGPISNLELPENVDSELAAVGKEAYDRLCMACHNPDQNFIGPSPKGIMDRRSPEWIMNMILNPDEMVAKDPIAGQLLIEYNGMPMANQGLTQDEARAILEYFRTL